MDEHPIIPLERMRLGLTPKQHGFCEAFMGMARGNGSEAARLAGYDGDSKQLRDIATRLLDHPDIRRMLYERIRQRMGADEVLALLASHARGSMEDFLDIDETDGTVTINLLKARARGQLHLVKKLTNRNGGIEIELHDAQGAASMICRHLGLFTDQLKIGVQVEQIQKVLEGLPAEYRDGVEAALADIIAQESEGEQDR